MRFKATYSPEVLFNISKQVEESIRLRRDDAIMGTHTYLRGKPCEVARCQPEIGNACLRCHTIKKIDDYFADAK